MLAGSGVTSYADEAAVPPDSSVQEQEVYSIDESGNIYLLEEDNGGVVEEDGRQMSRAASDKIVNFRANANGQTVTDTTAYTEYRTGESGYLYGKDFLASFVQLLPARDEGMRLDGACQLRRLRRTGGDGDMSVGRLRRVPCGPACGEGRVDAAFRAQAFHVDFADDELGVRGEAAGGGVGVRDTGQRFAEAARKDPGTGIKKRGAAHDGGLCLK